MKKAAVPIVAFALSLPALAAPPLTAPPLEGGPRDIVVTGRNKQELAERAAAFVRLSSVSGGIRALARWRTGICPKIFGATAEDARFFVERLRDIAATVGAPVAAANCRTNITVSFTRDPAGLMRSIEAVSPYELNETSPRQRELLRTGKAPVRWWYATEFQGRDGEAMGDTPPFAVLDNGLGGSGLPGSGHKSSLSLYGSSLVSTQAARALVEASVVIDLDQVGAVSRDALAGYVAMVTLAELKVDGMPPSGSALALFAEKATADEGLSIADQAFLKTVYRVRLDRPAHEQRSAIKGRMISYMLDPARR